MPIRAADRWTGDAAGLAEHLGRTIAGEVRFDAGSRALYSTDASNYRRMPIGVVTPRTADDVEATLAACREFGAPVLSRGGGTSLAGQCCNVAVVIDFSRHMNGIHEIDPGRREAHVQPGLVLDELNEAAGRHGLMFGPDPATANRCTIGGMIGNNSCGVHSLLTGTTADNVRTLDVLLADGTRMSTAAAPAAHGRAADVRRRLEELITRHAEAVRDGFPSLPRRVSGYNLDALLPERGFDLAGALVGTEGTCATVLKATLALVEAPTARAVAVVAADDIAAAADLVPAILALEPIGLEGLDASLVGSLHSKGLHPRGLELLPQAGSWLLVELAGSDDAELANRARRLARELAVPEGRVRLALDPADQQALWAVRKSGLAATATVPGKPLAWAGWEDSAVPPPRLGGYIRDLRALMAQHNLDGAMYGHFGEGCLHVRLTFDLRSANGVRVLRAFTEDAADLVVAHGGSLSGEHGDGQARGELLERMFGQELVEAFRAFKAIWDPGGMLNPGKVVDARPLDADLRLGADYAPWDPPTTFALAADAGSLAEASLRCVGVGECRKTTSGTMCPSYMVTGEEQHSTRGRARLLFEMLHGEVIDGGWRDEHVREALDLCLSCKACKTECPAGVDMATYKAEFLSRHHRGRLRPRSAYAMGLVPLWARLAAFVPGIANGLLAAPGVGGALRRLAGVDERRRLPSVAPRGALGEVQEGNRGGPPALLWVDTFTRCFAPEVARDAAAVLRDAGYDVVVPSAMACCGRPLYEFGMLPSAKRLLRTTVRTLASHLDTAAPIVALEPSCAVALRDELPALLPDDPSAPRVAERTVTLAQLLQSTPGYQPPLLDVDVLAQRHCQQAAVIGHDAEVALLERTGARVRWLDAGCCGMAGSFGYESAKYDVSVAIGERRLLPAVRSAPAETVVLADGFSCRSQIDDLAGRRAVHLAQLLAGGLTQAR